MSVQVWEYPDRKNAEETIEALRQGVRMDLCVRFFDFWSDDEGEVRRAILKNKNSDNIISFSVFNFCIHPLHRTQSFEFFLSMLEGSNENKADEFIYVNPFHECPTTLEEAKLLAAGIRSNSNIRLLRVHDSFTIPGALNHICNAVTDMAIPNLEVCLESKEKLTEDCFNLTGLAKNTTLKKLLIFYISAKSRIVQPQISKQISKIIKENSGLRSIYIDSDLINAEGCNLILEALKENSALEMLRMGRDNMARKIYCFGLTDEVVKMFLIQSKIDASIKKNKVWKKCNTERIQKLTNSPLNFYPNLLEILGAKPLLLYNFVRKYTPEILHSFSYQHQEP